MVRVIRWLKGMFGIKNTNSDQSSDDPKRRSINGVCYNDIQTRSDVAEAAWRRPSCSEKEQQRKHTMAVAAATSAAADAAVAAARAAVAVVRLTGHGGCALIGRSTSENAAAVRIQTVFRGYLSRKALRALKGLVKLQAIVRGHLVRKQSILTLKGLQALRRVQSMTRPCRPHRETKKTIDYTSMDKMGDASQMRRRSSSSIPLIESINGRRNSPSRRKSSVTSLVDDYPNCCRIAQSPDLPSHFSGNISTPSGRFNFLQELHYKEIRRCSSAQNTPNFANTTRSDDVFKQRMERVEFVFPSYMANTQSFNAKARSNSAPKQRTATGISRVCVHEMLDRSRNSFSGIRRQHGLNIKK